MTIVTDSTNEGDEKAYVPQYVDRNEPINAAQNVAKDTPSMEVANHPAIYKQMMLGVVVAVVGVYLRFVYDSTILSIISWVILFAGAFIAFSGVMKILNSSKRRNTI